MLRRGVRRDPAVAPKPFGGGDVDDASLAVAHQVREAGADHACVAVEVDVERRVPRRLEVRPCRSARGSRRPRCSRGCRSGRACRRRRRRRRRTCASSRTSSAHAAALPPAPRISSATVAAPSSVTSVTATDRTFVAEEVRGGSPHAARRARDDDDLACDRPAPGDRRGLTAADSTLAAGCSLVTGPARLGDGRSSRRRSRASPLGLSLWALLDAAHRPEWAWALAGRRRVVWIAAIMFGILTVVGGLLISGVLPRRSCAPASPPPSKATSAREHR